MKKARKSGTDGRMRILIGYDGTPEADKVLRDLGRAALPASAEVLVISFIEPWARFAEPEEGTTGWPSAAALRQYQVQLDAVRQAAGKKADRAAKSLARRFPGWKVSAETGLGPIAQGLLTRAEKWKAHLIVVGSHGRGLLGRAILGSVSDKVVHHAKSDVRVSRAGTISRAYPPRIMVAVDGSASSLHAAEAAARRPWPKGTRVKIIGVVDPRYAVDGFLAESAMVVLPMAEARSWLQRKVAEAARKFSGSGIQTESIIQMGDARHVLIKEAKAWKADCVFLGASGLTGIGRLLIGSVSSALAAHAPCSVEIVRKSARRLQKKTG